MTLRVWSIRPGLLLRSAWTSTVTVRAVEPIFANWRVTEFSVKSVPVGMVKPAARLVVSLIVEELPSAAPKLLSTTTAFAGCTVLNTNTTPAIAREKSKIRDTSFNLLIEISIFALIWIQTLAKFTNWLLSLSK